MIIMYLAGIMAQLYAVAPQITVRVESHGSLVLRPLGNNLMIFFSSIGENYEF
jgi:hypothetical protein